MAVVNWQLVSTSPYTIDYIAGNDNSPYFYAMCSDNYIRAFIKATYVAAIQTGSTYSGFDRMCVSEDGTELLVSNEDEIKVLDSTTLSQTQHLWLKTRAVANWLVGGYTHIQEVAICHDADYAEIEALGGSWGWFASGRQLYATSSYIYTHETTYGQFVRWPRPTPGAMSQVTLTATTTNITGYSPLQWGGMVKIGSYIYGGFGDFYYGSGGPSYIGFNPSDVGDQDWLEITATGTFKSVMNFDGALVILGKNTSDTTGLFRTFDSGTGALDTATVPGTITTAAFTGYAQKGVVFYDSATSDFYLAADNKLFKYTGDIETVSLPTPSATCTVP